MAGKVRISACIIMRDAAEDIEECLRSLLGLVDEFIVVDTGSVDDSVSIAEKLVGKVYHFPWRDDFSAAKNYAIEQATGDWIVFLDADEALTEETRQNLPSLLSKAEGLDKILVHRYNVRSDNGAQAGPDDIVERILRREEGLRFRDPIHEYIDFSDGHSPKAARIPPGELAIRHKGYSPERMEAKNRRNLRLLEDMRAKGMEKPFLYCYLAISYGSLEEYEKMAECARIAVERGERPEGDASLPYRYLCEALSHREDGEALLEILGRAMEAFPEHPYFFHEYGREMEKLGRPREALDSLLRAERNARAFGDTYPGWASWIQEELPDLCEALAQLLVRMGNPARGKSFRRKAERERKKAHRLKNMHGNFVKKPCQTEENRVE